MKACKLHVSKISISIQNNLSCHINRWIDRDRKIYTNLGLKKIQMFLAFYSVFC